jgi:hypothetical protein
MRAVSLSNESVLNALRTQFVCGYKNITGEPYAGASGLHATEGQAVETTNGAGPHNVQLFMLHADGTVLHCLPGYWSPQDLLREMRFALELKKAWEDPKVTLTRKKELFRLANLRDIRTHPADMVARSHLQSFDAIHERRKADSDFKFKPGDYRPPYVNRKMPDLKTTDQVVHERMAQRPYISYDKFDVEKFSDYGKWKYDKREDSRPAIR